MKIIYVVANTFRCGGHKIVVEHLNRFADRGYDCELCFIGDSLTWVKDINFELKRFDNPDSLIKYLAENKDAVKVATFWTTAEWVVKGGGGYYLIFSIPTPHYQNDNSKNNILNTYKLGLKHIVQNVSAYAILKYVFDVKVKRIDILAVDHDIFRPLKIDKKHKTGLYCYRNKPMKNPRMMEETMSIIKDFKLYSYSESCPFANKSFVNISDNRVAEIMNQAEVFISTSIHEGFCLPLLESMACGIPVITTRAVGNETFCIDGINCLIVENSTELKEAITKILTDKNLAKRLSDNGIETANNYQWNKVIYGLEKLYIKKGNIEQYLSHDEIAGQLTEDEKKHLFKEGAFGTAVRPNDVLQKVVYNLFPKVKVIVEIGTWRGLSSLAMASCSNVEHLYTFDIIPSVYPWVYWEKFKVADKITYVCRSSSKKIYKDIKKIKFDLGYIDGSHTPDIEEDDFSCMKKYCDRILLDDTDNEDIFNIIKAHGGKRISYRFGYWSADNDYSIVDIIKKEITWDEPYGKRDCRHLEGVK